MTARRRKPLWSDRHEDHGHDWLGPGLPQGPPPAEPEPAPAPSPPPSPGGGWRLGVLSGLVGAVAVAAALVGAGVVGEFDDDPPPLPAAPPLATAGGGTDARVSAVYRATGGSVVSVRAPSAGRTATGTGFVIDRDGTIVTNAHVVEGARQVEVRFGDRGRRVHGRVVGTDPSSDLAVVDVDASATRDVRALTLADSDRVRVGELAVAIGSPFGLDRTATAGIVSSLGRQIQAPNGFSIDEVIQTDAPINPGNSGGPLLNAAGQVIGVNSQIATAGAQGNVGVGFAVPSNTVRRVVPALQRDGRVRHAYLGVSMSENPSGDGVLVADLPPGGPADDAGLRAGDEIVSVAGRPVRGSGDVSAAVNSRDPGDRVRVEVLRDGRRLTIEVKLGARPERATP
ncbi:MAG TPA: trypsin-like peptidase domain-containing protein [Solirubrobacteraceae bacterium]|nr:trypsin-like peptidase domain-containing protein [Solirubrobacteraceae bacterium]